MERALKELFDFQYIAQNKRLSALIAQTEARYSGNALSDSDLELVNAAGDPNNQLNEDKNHDRRD